MEHAHLAFTLAVQRALAGAPTSAACWSPYSVASALGLAATGARGATRAELGALLLRGGATGGGWADGGNAGDLGGSGDLGGYSAMLGEASVLGAGVDGGAAAPGSPVLDVANTLWTREDTPIRAEFTAELGRWPNGGVRPAPFHTQPDVARQLINTDVAETTHGLIPELLGAGSVTADTAATLVNALYLKVAWRNAFPDRGTTPRPFRTPTGPTEVPTMRLSGKRLGYTAGGGWQVVVLAAAGDVDAVVLLPDGDLATAEPALAADALAGLLAAPVPMSVDLYLPRFRVRANANLTTALGSLGVHTMFSDQADFSGISDRPMAVSSVRHEAVLTVDEQGLEGAAATGMVMRALSLHRDASEPVVVRVDRPFLFVVRHRPSGAVYFLARVTSP
ncbi:MAG TPA: serpin family protein [Pseudonocardiaceae bacterium]